MVREDETGTKKESGTSMSFEYIRITSSSKHKTTKELDGTKAIVQVTRKDIFVGANGNWKLSWNKVQAVQFASNDNNIDNPAKDNFSCDCRIVTDRNTVDCWLDETEQVHRAGTPWYVFRRYIEKRWDKEQRKAEQREERERQKRQDDVRARRRDTHTSKRQRSGKGKRYALLANQRAVDFSDEQMNPNYGSLEEDYDDNIFNRGHKRPRKPTKEQQQMDDDSPMGQNDDLDTEFQIEENFSDNDMDIPPVLEDEQDDHNHDDEPSPPLDVDEIIDSDQDGDVYSPFTNHRASKRPKSKRLYKKEKQSLHSDPFGDTDDEDEQGLFNDENPMTTPLTAKRIVSPATTASTVDQKSSSASRMNRLVSNKYGMSDTKKQLSSGQDNHDGEEESVQNDDESRRGLQDITNFFAPKKSNSVRTKLAKDSSKRRQQGQPNGGISSPGRKENQPVALESASSEKQQMNATKEEATHSPSGTSEPISSFFAPRRPRQCEPHGENKSSIPAQPSKDRRKSVSKCSSSADSLSEQLLQSPRSKDSIENEISTPETKNHDKMSTNPLIPSTPTNKRISQSKFFRSSKGSRDEEDVEDFHDDLDDSKSESPLQNSIGSPKQHKRRVPVRPSFRGRTYGSTGRQKNSTHVHPPSRADLALEFAEASDTNTLSLVPVQSQSQSPTSKITNPYKSQTVPSRTYNTRSSPWRGLVNFGNTCYMNASLQMLFSVPHFMGLLQKTKESFHNQQDLPMVSSLCDLFQDLKLSTDNKGSATARQIKAAVDAKTDKFLGSHQRDAHEFLGDLLDQIHQELEVANVQDSEESTNPKNSEDGEKSKLNDVEGVKLETEDALTDKDNDSSTDTIKIVQSKSDESSESITEDEVTSATEGKNDTKLLLPDDDHFRLDVQVRLQCLSCGYFRTKEEMYRCLSLDIVDISDERDSESTHGDSPLLDDDVQVIKHRSVNDCLKQFFRPEERDIKCEKCTDGIKAIQTMQILSRPKSLLLHLKRFEVVETRSSPDTTTGDGPMPLELTFRKNREPVGLSETVCLDPFLASESFNSTKEQMIDTDRTLGKQKQAQRTTCTQQYSIQSIVHHIGSTADSGHYTADALRHTSASSKWVSFDDGITNETSSIAVLGSVKKERTAYMILYSIEQQDVTESKH